MPFKQGVRGSNPRWITNYEKPALRGFFHFIKAWRGFWVFLKRIFIFLNKHQKRQKTKSCNTKCNTKKREAEASPFTCSPHWLLAYIVVLWYNLIKAQPCQRLAVIPTEPIEGRWCYGYILGAFSASHVACGICQSDFSDMQKKMTALTPKWLRSNSDVIFRE